MPNYVREQTIGEIARNTFHIYRRYSPQLFLSCGLVFVPLVLLRHMLYPTDEEFRVRGIDWLNVLLIDPIVMAATSVLLWDICMDNAPGVSRAFRKVLRTGILRIFLVRAPESLIAAPLMGGFVVDPLMVGFLTLVLLGISALFMFVLPVAVLEDLPVISALQRSMELGKGHYARNSMILFCIAGVLGICSALLQATLRSVLPEPFALRTSNLIVLLVDCFCRPIYIIPIILLYFDMRARKEAHGLAMLGQDLRR